MITKEQFNLWKHEPVTRWFFAFLKDKQDFLKSAALEQWLNSSSWPETVRGQIIELSEIAETSHEAIQSFYTREDESRTESDA